MWKLVGSAMLLLLSLFMLVGFLQSDAPRTAPATLAALLITVALPAAGGVALAFSYFGGGGRLSRRREELRQQTIESEILRLAGQHAGKLTAVEVSQAMAITPEAAKDALDALAERFHADLEITDSGVIVYSFHDVRHLGQKATAKGVLDA